MATIVVMDDEPFVRKLIKDILEGQGHTVWDFPDAGPVLEDVDFSKIDLVITDLNMPTRGEVAIQAIRERTDLPIIVVSGYLGKDSCIKAERFGVQAVLAKPFNIKDLTAEVRKWVAVEEPEPTMRVR